MKKTNLDQDVTELPTIDAETGKVELVPEEEPPVKENMSAEELLASWRCLVKARDENANRVSELRDQVFVLRDALIRTLSTDVVEEALAEGPVNNDFYSGTQAAVTHIVKRLMEGRL